MRIIPLAGEAEPMLSPDLVWDGIMGDLALAEPSEVSNRGGLRARAQLETAVLICLMSDARAAPEELRDGDTNRGWPGDTFDLDFAAGEAPIGSRLWLLERSTVDAVETPRRAEDYARAALQPLLDQGAAAAVTAKAEADPARNRLTLDVTLTDKAGGVLVSRRFSLLWEGLAGISVPYRPLAPGENAVTPIPPVPPPLFGASLPAGMLLGDEPDGFALDFARNSGLVRSSSDKSLQKSGTIADLCTFTRATAATYFDRNGILRTAGPNVLRLTHDPVTGKSLGYLAEAQATNLWRQSGNLSAPGWAWQSGTGIVTAGDNSIFGGSLWAIDLGPAQDRRQSNTVTANTQIAISFACKRGNQPVARVEVHFTGGTGTQIAAHVYNFDTESLIVNGSNNITINSYRRTLYPSGEVLIESVVTPSNGSTTAYTLVHGGISAGGVTQYGRVQVETGAYPTSYIPTTTAAATRAADTMSVDLSKLPFDPAEFTLVGEAVRSPDAASFFYTLASVYKDGSEYVTVRNGAAGLTRLKLVNRTGSVNVSVFETANGVVTPRFKWAGAFKSADYELVANGVRVGASAVGSLASGLTALSIGYHGTAGGGPYSAPMASLCLIPRRLSQAEMIARTTL